ncbi:hypothetical protein MOV66_19165 [Agrobacterium sp. SHOUNA12C]|uniref:hypothetical protein n=1 Tax=Rhizobium rhizogenes TaxID=359 RepID=UPI0005A79367|nr:hypothetical protein [Rhizobium rhizogenes]MCJ9723448.1 hypothetical protein [Agrobacterium sp. BETTINA12B]MCJ9758777.1 hypothetical protein [Agrobacterium sp. SHOUNA12C]NTH26800.1 hypothetical protein [Rhizobium rhizogenes]OCJ08765.1 hypothetical protein A6U88_23470 [Agrobacterium sp. B131/95]
MFAIATTELMAPRLKTSLTEDALYANRNNTSAVNIAKLPMILLRFNASLRIVTAITRSKRIFDSLSADTSATDATVTAHTDIMYEAITKRDPAANWGALSAVIRLGKRVHVSQS